ncbi:MAG: hypothetical protein H7Z74_10230 [Anaerolineae bacterium]|nr:hypothetical protein [Gemmatimonadaceae bacterium]
MKRESTLSLSQRLITTVLRRVDVVAADLGTVVKDLSTPGIRRLEKADLPAYLSLRPLTSGEAVLDRLRRGQRCYALWSDSAIVSVCWATAGPVQIDYLDGTLVLEPDDIYMFDAYTAPGHRGQTLAAIVYSHIMWTSWGEGMRRSVGLLAVENKAGRQVVLKLGWTVIGRHTLIRAYPWRRWLLVSSHGEKSLPALRL